VATGGAVLTGLALQSGAESFTGGTLVTWPKTAGTLGWGLLSVGHAVQNTTVQISPPGQPAFYGTVRYGTTADDNLDAAFIEVDPADVQASLGAYLPAPGAAGPVAEPLGDLLADSDNQHAVGGSLRVPGRVDFTLFHYFPSQNPSDPLIQQAPNAAPLLGAHSDTQGAFARGTSGSAWVKNDTGNALGVQIGAFPDETDPVTGQVIAANVFQRGLAQPTAAYLQWAATQVGAPVTLVAVF
jgi:hypothetical protein